MMTSFDGKYELEGDEKSKWIRFTFIDDSEKIDIEEGSGELIKDFAFDGIYPVEGENDNEGIVLKSRDELLQEDMEFRESYSLYSTFYDNSEYNEALPHWKKIYNKYPKAHTNVYIQGLSIKCILIL